MQESGTPVLARSFNSSLTDESALPLMAMFSA
jgi:hypothetical protein